MSSDSSHREQIYRSEWLLKHEHASSLVFDEKTGVPHQAIYNYPASTIAWEEENRAFWAAVQKLRIERGDFDDDEQR